MTRCSNCQAVMNPKWERCIVCGCLVGGFDAELEYQFEERAGICQHDGGLSREEAEALAKETILKKEILQ